MSTTTTFGETASMRRPMESRNGLRSLRSRTGGWVVTWGARNQNDVPQESIQQRYDAKGLTIGDEVRVNMTSIDTGEPDLLHRAIGWRMGGDLDRTGRKWRRHLPTALQRLWAEGRP